MFTEYVTFRYDSSGESATDKPVGRTGSYTRRETRLAALNRQEQDSTAKDYKKVGALTFVRKKKQARSCWSDSCGAENRGSPITRIYFCNIPTRRGARRMGDLSGLYENKQYENLFLSSPGTRKEQNLWNEGSRP